MRRVRHLTAIVAVTLLAMGGTVAYAEDEAPDTTTTTAVPEPTVTIVVDDVPAPQPEPSTTEAPQVDPTTAAVAEPPATEPPATEPPATEAPTGSTTSDAPPAPSADPPPADDAVAPPTTHNPVQVDSSETAIVTGTQVANADTGNNATDSHSSNPPAGGQQPNAIGTGDATAVGSDDTNVVNQQAQVELTDQAIANLLQVALILNIGAALANSGVNDAVSTPGGNGITGAIDSGNATAIGNDMQQYITQAARATGDENTDDAAKQLAVSLWMGLANANSGLNSATGTGTAGSGGQIGTGDASATGNQSLTDVLQQAALQGSGTSQLDVQQYATIMNLGFALANSGVNDITGVASGLLSAGDDETQNALAVDLFSMLLPALMQSFTASGGAGTIGTGNATAVGNRSETYVHQLAEAAASGDGIATIIQDVLVANVGAAGANTGGNVLGGRHADLDPDQAKAVVTLAAFLSQMLALVHTRSADAAQAMQQSGMEIPFGDIVLTVQGQLQGYDTMLTGPTGQQATIRQVTIILSLGIAQSNSGLNRALGVNQDNQLAAAVNGAWENTATGDALAANRGLVIICQRRNADDIECLKPPEPPEEPTTTTTVPTEESTSSTLPTGTTVPPGVVPPSPETPSGPQGFGNPTADSSTHGASANPLPSTGSDVADILLYAGLTLMAGLVALTISSRRRYVPQPVGREPDHRVPED
jgi:LPXTG-motif cell wall-anchored protein